MERLKVCREAALGSASKASHWVRVRVRVSVRVSVRVRVSVWVRVWVRVRVSCCASAWNASTAFEQYEEARHST